MKTSDMTTADAAEALRRHKSEKVAGGCAEVNQACRVLQRDTRWFVYEEWQHFDCGTLLKACENYGLAGTLQERAARLVAEAGGTALAHDVAHQLGVPVLELIAANSKTQKALLAAGLRWHYGKHGGKRGYWLSAREEAA